MTPPPEPIVVFTLRPRRDLRQVVRGERPGKKIGGGDYSPPPSVLLRLAFGLELQLDGKPRVERPLIGIPGSRGLQEVHVLLDRRVNAGEEPRVVVPVD